MDATRRRLTAGLFGAVGISALVGAWPHLAHADDGDEPPNVFISPCGQPFRAKLNAPYPISDWFKQADSNADGRIDHAEFLADAEAFFKALDLNHDGVIEPFEVNIYEQRIAPEVLGYRVIVSQTDPERARLWLAQGGDGMSIDPGGAAAEDDPNASKPPVRVDESGQGASPFSLFNEPEPITAADFDFNGRISLKNFLKLADAHFSSLDKDSRGYLTLDKLPKTPMQVKVELWRRQHHGA